MERQKIIRLTDGRCNLEVISLKQACNHASCWYTYLLDEENHTEHYNKIFGALEDITFLFHEKAPDVTALQVGMSMLEAHLQAILGVSEEDWPSVTVTEE